MIDRIDSPMKIPAGGGEVKLGEGFNQFKGKERVNHVRAIRLPSGTNSRGSFTGSRLRRGGLLDEKGDITGGF